jgi:hypothetical protein
MTIKNASNPKEDTDSLVSRTSSKQVAVQSRPEMHKGNRLLRVFVTLSLGEPCEECLGGLADLLAGREIDVLLAGLRAPFGNDILGEDVLIVQDQEDLGSLVVECSVLLTPKSNESLDASKESLLMLLRCYHLCKC